MNRVGNGCMGTTPFFRLKIVRLGIINGIYFYFFNKVEDFDRFGFIEIDCAKIFCRNNDEVSRSILISFNNLIKGNFFFLYFTKPGKTNLRKILISLFLKKKIYVLQLFLPLRGTFFRPSR